MYMYNYYNYYTSLLLERIEGVMATHIHRFNVRGRLEVPIISMCELFDYLTKASPW